MTWCSNCGENETRDGQRYCNPCHASYMRAHRVKHRDLPDEARMRANARAYANTYQKRGKLIPEPCRICGSMEELEKHHEDYSKPLEVIWYCREHHLAHHGTDKQIAHAAFIAVIRKHI